MFSRAGWARSATQWPLLLSLGATLAVMGIGRARGLEPLRGSTYARWDSFNYLSIASRGYSLEEQDGHVVGGNVAWFPGYPLLIRAVASRRLTPARAGAIISTLCGFFLLVSLWQVLRKREGDVVTLSLAALFPGFVYYHAVFPISMVATAAVLAILISARGNHLGAGFAGAIAAFTYPSGFLVAGPLVWGVLRDPRLSPRGRLAALLAGPGLVALGLFSVFAYQARSVGWTAFFRMRAEYFDNEPSNPLADFVQNTSLVWAGAITPQSLPQFQTVLVAILVVASCIIAWRQAASLTLVEQELLAGGILFWIFPYFLGRGISPCRAEALVVGIVPILGRLPLAGRWALLAVLALLGIGMCGLFFDSVLV